LKNKGEISLSQLSKADSVQQPVSNSRIKIACSSCNLQELCLPVILNMDEIRQLDEVSHLKRNYMRGDYLYRSGNKFQSLYAIYRGTFKTQVLHEDGREQVTGFRMIGDVIGLDAIFADYHSCDAVALENSEVCELPFNKLEALSRKLPSLQRHLHKILSREIVRNQGIMLLLGSMRAEERLAVFLLSLSQRFAARGLSPTKFQLRMSRQEFGSYLGLKLETVSRAFSHFQSTGLINVNTRTVELIDLPGLQAFIGRQP